MREMLRGSIGKSLQALGEEDRLSAAWMVVCGKALSARGLITGYADGIVHVEVVDTVWLQQLTGMRKQMIRELAEIASVPVKDVRFRVRGAVERNQSRREGRR